MKKTSTFGIIHIGSIHTSMAIVKYHSPTQIEVIDSANKELPLGEEVFRTHRLSFASIHALSTILQGFRQLLLDYRVSEVYPIATTVVREAENRLGILDLLYMRTGFRFHVADMTEEVYYKFFALHHFLKRMSRSARSRRCCSTSHRAASASRAGRTARCSSRRTSPAAA